MSGLLASVTGGADGRIQVTPIGVAQRSPPLAFSAGRREAFEAGSGPDLPSVRTAHRVLLLARPLGPPGGS